MSKLNDLILQYCPDGVEYRPLEDVAMIKRGERVTKAQLLSNGQYPVISGGVKPLGYLDRYNRNENTITVAQYGTAGYVDWQKSKFWANDVCYSIFPSSIINNRYLYFVLLKNQNLLYSLKTNAIPSCLPVDKLASISIPVPPLPVQEEIVRILDNFSLLSAELEAELEGRRKQYDFYRTLLLDFSEGKKQAYEGQSDPRNLLLSFDANADSGSVQWKTLGEIAEIKTGRRFVRTDIKESGVPCFHYGDLYTYYGLTATDTKGYLDEELAKKLRFAQPNDVVVVCAGENDMDIGVGVAWLGDQPAVVHDACCIVHHQQNPRYLAHFFRTHNYHLQMKKYVKNGKISSLPSSGLAQALIPIPSLEEQQRIVDILDRFDTLTNDLSQGLPAEIEARKKQYEYYRDKLLTFKRKGE